jgi:5-methylcytosine-specific restriction protein B
MNEITLDRRIQESLVTAHDAIVGRGELLSVDRIRVCYAAFRERFGPDKLRALDGGTLLQAMHSYGNKQSLVYWLEFKNDDDFPGQAFGGIGGGSAHKFGLFKRKDTGQWVKGGAKSEKAIDEAEAVTIARMHRDQLLAAAALIERLPAQVDDEGYLNLQDELGQVAPAICNLAWAHKYLSLLFPDKLDDFHSEHWQRFNLIKILQTPPAKEGLYVCAGRFVQLAARFEWPITHLTAALKERNGRPIRYWRIGTRLNEKDSIWQDMRNGSYAAIGWSALGDLSPLRAVAESKSEIRKLLEQHYPGDAKLMSRKAGEVRNFLIEMSEGETDGDVVLAADGQTVVGLGRVTGPYRFENTSPTGAPHRRAVRWISTEDWKMLVSEGLRTTVFPVKKSVENLIEIERRLLDGVGVPPESTTSRVIGSLQGLSEIPNRIHAILERKGQAILYGPPGTGKTYWARKTAFDLAALCAYKRLFSDLDAEEKAKVEGSDTVPGLVRLCTFHPAYGYEDFIEGYRPKSAEGQLVFTLERGIFRAICEDASGKPEKYILLIDEINRGDIPRIFGELLTILEFDKRGQNVILPLSGMGFTVPSNLYVIGTMNTADRSIALLDTALRRRFGFVELLPDVGVFGSASVDGSIPLGPWLNALNERIRAHLGRDGRNLQIGHAYLLEGAKPVTDFLRFVRILADDIIPLLEEYCYENFGTLTQILGPGLVDETRQRIREELFTPARREELVQALLAPAPEIMTSPLAVLVDETAEEPEEPETKGNDT